MDTGPGYRTTNVSGALSDDTPTSRLRLRDGPIVFIIALVAYIAAPLAARALFGADSPAVYAAAFVAAPLLTLAALAWPLLVRRCRPAELGLAAPQSGWLLRAALAAPVIIAGSVAMALAIEAVFDVSFEEINESLYALGDLDTAGLIVAGIGIVLIAPATEEILMRGAVYGALRSRFGPGPTIALSAALFSVLHVAWAVMPIIFALGLVFGWLRHRSGSVLPCILLHALNNGWSFGIYLLLR